MTDTSAGGKQFNKPPEIRINLTASVRALSDGREISNELAEVSGVVQRTLEMMGYELDADRGYKITGKYEIVPNTDSQKV